MPIVINGTAGDDTIDYTRPPGRTPEVAETINGLGGNDTISGFRGNDILNGDAGNDTLYGQEDNDILNGGDGNDLLSGDIGSDMIDGGANDDILSGGDGNDIIRGGEGIDTISGGKGNDTVDAGEGDDTVDGGDGDDIIHGGSGADTLAITRGVDQLFGDGGNDIFQISNGLSSYDISKLVTIDGGDGIDTVFAQNLDNVTKINNVEILDMSEVFSMTATVEFINSFATIRKLFEGMQVRIKFDIYNGGVVDFSTKTFAFVEISAYSNASINITGTKYNDILTGNDGDDTLNGGDGADTLISSGASNSTSGGTNTLIGGSGNDIIDVSNGQNTAYGGEGNDIFIHDEIYKDHYNQYLSAYDNALFGNNGNDTFEFHVGSGSVDGGDGIDTVVGGPDTYDLGYQPNYELKNIEIIRGAGLFKLSASSLANVSEISTSVGIEIVGSGGIDFSRFVKGLNRIVASSDGGKITGTRVNDKIDGRDGVDELVGGFGDDQITGGGGDDLLSGGDGRDNLVGGEGADTLDGGTGNDTYGVDNADDRVIEAVGEGDDLVVATVSYALAADQEIETLQLAKSTGTANLNLTGNEFGQTLRGNGGDNLLDGGSGADTLIGGGGDDTFVVDQAGDIIIENAGGGDDTVIATASYALTAGQEIEALQLAKNTGTQALSLTGNEIANTLRGNDGVNFIDGKGGADLMYGKGGGDTYLIDNVGDQVFESKGQGYDTVVTSVSFALAAGQEVEALQLDGSANLTLIGNEFGQTLRDNAGNNQLSGGGGDDIIVSTGGKDVLDGGAGGDSATIDRSKVTVALTFQMKSVSGTTTLVGDGTTTTSIGKIALTGGSGNDRFATLDGNDVLDGGAGDDLLEGGAGADRMSGGTGNDTFAIDSSGDRVFEARGQGKDMLVSTISYALAAGQEVETMQFAKATGSANLSFEGNEFGQLLMGNAGANKLNGGLGNDTLTGRAGADTFVFTTKLGPDNVDHITDFAAEDTIKLAKGVFLALAPGELAEGAFKNISAAKTDADDRILYKQATGELFYDADGSGKVAAVLFAVLDNKAALTAGDILIA